MREPTADLVAAEFSKNVRRELGYTLGQEVEERVPSEKVRVEDDYVVDQRTVNPANYSLHDRDILGRIALTN